MYLGSVLGTADAAVSETQGPISIELTADTQQDRETIST